MPQFPKHLRPLYRVYHLDRIGGIVHADIIEALGDEDAIDRILGLADDHAVELWDRGRFVAKVEPPPNALIKAPVVTRPDTEVSVIHSTVFEDVPVTKPTH